MRPYGSFGSLLVLMRPYVSLWVFIGLYVSLLFLMRPYGLLYVLLRPYWS